jgi:hypothetical protein
VEAPVLSVRHAVRGLGSHMRLWMWGVEVRV